MLDREEPVDPVAPRELALPVVVVPFVWPVVVPLVVPVAGEFGLLTVPVLFAELPPAPVFPVFTVPVLFGELVFGEGFAVAATPLFRTG